MSVELICQSDISDVFVGLTQAHCENWRCHWNHSDPHEFPVKYDICGNSDDCNLPRDEKQERQCTVGHWKLLGQSYIPNSYVCHHDILWLNSTLMCKKIECPSGYSVCPNSEKCILTTEFCNGAMWRGCPNRADEDSVFCQTWPCPDGYWKCVASGKCIKKVFVCDDDHDCDLSDEDPELCINWACPEFHMKCKDQKQCIARTKVCDGAMNDCNDGSDELDCKHWPCSIGHIKCGDLLQCIPVSKNILSANAKNCSVSVLYQVISLCF